FFELNLAEHVGTSCGPPAFAPVAWTVAVTRTALTITAGTVTARPITARPFTTGPVAGGMALPVALGTIAAFARRPVFAIALRWPGLLFGPRLVPRLLRRFLLPGRRLAALPR